MSMQDDIKAIERVTKAAHTDRAVGVMVDTSDLRAAIHAITRKDEEIAAKSAVIAELVKAADRLSFCAQTTGGIPGPDKDLIDAISRIEAPLTRAKEQSND